MPKLTLHAMLGNYPNVAPLKSGAVSLEIVIDFCRQQKLISRAISVDELFDDTTRVLGTN